MNTIEKNIKALLAEVDTDPSREGLQDTPARYARFIKEFVNPPEFNPTVFEGEGYDKMIVQDNITFYSLCEHHMLPFFGIGTIGYIPKQKIIGLSKLARTLETFSRRLQNQERITMQVADYLEEILSPKGVGVVLTARHLCMEMRGVSKPNACTTTSTLRGLFKSNSQTRLEFLDFKKGTR
jgi:GTP cyclohydrolase I